MLKAEGMLPCSGYQRVLAHCLGCEGWGGWGLWWLYSTTSLVLLSSLVACLIRSLGVMATVHDHSIACQGSGTYKQGSSVLFSGLAFINFFMFRTHHGLQALHCSPELCLESELSCLSLKKGFGGFCRRTGQIESETLGSVYMHNMHASCHTRGHLVVLKHFVCIWSFSGMAYVLGKLTNC